MTKPAEASTRPIRPWVEAALLAWVEQHAAPGGAFATIGHAAQVGLGRLQDELAVLAKRCKAEGVRFEWAAARRAYAAVLEAHQPVTLGRPRQGAPHVERRRANMFIDPGLLEWAEGRASTFFSATDPVTHAIDAALRNLMAAEDSDALRSAAFPFDEDALWRRYKSR